MRGHIEQILMDIANAYEMGALALIPYCYEDTIGGWDHDAGRWPVGSIWSVEGRVIYALLRYTQPDYAVEIGTYHGCSAEHIAAAFRDNGKGKLYCVDNHAWGVPPDHLAEWALEYIEFVEDDGAHFLETDPIISNVGFVFEDGDHSSELTEAVWRASANIQPGGFIVSHDAMHFLVGDAIRAGIVASGVPNPRFYLIEPSDCGLGMARIPLPEVVDIPDKRKNDKALFDDDDVLIDEPIPEPTKTIIKPKRKRSPRKRTPAKTQEPETEAAAQAAF